MTSPGDKGMFQNSCLQAVAYFITKGDCAETWPFVLTLASPWEFSVSAVLSQVANFFAKHVGFSEVGQTALNLLCC